MRLLLLVRLSPVPDGMALRFPMYNSLGFCKRLPCLLQGIHTS